jgi:predicted nucleotide-binding protein (sugar kinase/HSP70/actin superfamily)
MPLLSTLEDVDEVEDVVVVDGVEDVAPEIVSYMEYFNDVKIFIINNKKINKEIFFIMFYLPSLRFYQSFMDNMLKIIVIVSREIILSISLCRDFVITY